MTPRWLRSAGRWTLRRRGQHPDLDQRITESHEAAQEAHARAAVARRVLEENNLALIVNTALGIDVRGGRPRGKS